MIRAVALCTVAAMATSTPLAAKEKPPHVYGPPPEWEDFRKLAEAGLAARLVDPESARVTWIDGYNKGFYKPLFQARISGYFACGEINARNRMGGYTGSSAFVVVIDFGRVLYVDMDGSRSSLVAAQCGIARKAGQFPPLPPATIASAAPTATNAVATSASGLSLRAMPEGAYVTAVTAGSAAATAGFKPGMVISSVNAIPLATMGDAMLKVVDAAGAGAAFVIVGGSTLKLPGSMQP